MLAHSCSASICGDWVHCSASEEEIHHMELMKQSGLPHSGLEAETEEETRVNVPPSGHFPVTYFLQLSPTS